MHQNLKCLSNEIMEILLLIAEKGEALSFSRRDDLELISELVNLELVFQGGVLSTSPSSIYYRITKNGFLTLQCNLLWNTYDEVNASQKVVDHINCFDLECQQGCLEKNVNSISEDQVIFFRH